MAKIYNNGEELISGDDTSIELIFNNLSGENFKGKEYKEYLLMMKKSVGFEFGTLKIKSSKREEIKNIDKVN